MPSYCPASPALCHTLTGPLLIPSLHQPSLGLLLPLPLKSNHCEAATECLCNQTRPRLTGRGVGAQEGDQEALTRHLLLS